MSESPPTEASRSGPESHATERLLRNALTVVGLLTALVVVYGLQSESALARAAGLQLLLLCLTLWAASNASATRQRLKAAPPEGADDTSEPEAQSAPESAAARAVEAWSLHHLFVASGAIGLLVLTGFAALFQFVEVAFPPGETAVIAMAITGMLLAGLATGFAHAFRQHAACEVERAFLETRLIGFLVTLASVVQLGLPGAHAVAAWTVLAWVVLVSAELFLRSAIGWQVTASGRFGAIPPLLVREVFLSSLNPIGSLFDVAEERLGLSFRSSWTLRFFRRSILPLCLAGVFILWGATALVVIEPHQLGVAERFGRPQAGKLQPGLHVQLPWPLGRVHRVPVRSVQTLQIGFSDPVDTEAAAQDRQRAFLWTQPHAEEFLLMLGTETELVAINAVVTFHIGDDAESLRHYVYRHSDPVPMLESLAYRALREETQSATLDELLSVNRDAFAKRIQTRVQAAARAERLGLKIVDVALLNLHPPVEVADAYLNVINANLAAEQTLLEAKGAAAERLLQAEAESRSLTSQAKAQAARRVSRAGQESQEFLAVGQAYQAAPATYQLRLWLEAVERTLRGRQLYLLDADLPDVVLDNRSSAGSVDPSLLPPAVLNRDAVPPPSPSAETP